MRAKENGRTMPAVPIEIACEIIAVEQLIKSQLLCRYSRSPVKFSRSWKMLTKLR